MDGGRVSVSSTSGSVAISQATSSTASYLSATDWNAVNGKQSALGYAPLNKAGDSMSGNLAIGESKISGLADPTAAGEAATKAYADAKVGGETFDQAGRGNEFVIKWDAGTRSLRTGPTRSSSTARRRYAASIDKSSRATALFRRPRE